MRAFLNLRLAQEMLRGKTIDVGGGKHADYLSFMKKDDQFELLHYDVKTGAEIDFEKDRLPAEDGTYATVLFLNVMEHIFNHQHIANEVVRIVGPGGRLIGFTPFLMLFHGDPNDYFRYTNEALQKILEKTGATNTTIVPIAKGPFIAACHMIMLWFPIPLRVPLFLISYFLDVLFLKLKPSHGPRYALGYLFLVQK
jgi:SAM-dependent methyltransferase